MSLVLTELSEAGIAMAADSAISYETNGRLSTEKRDMWRKLVRVPRIKAGISYWGDIGLINAERFDTWLERKVSNGAYTNLRSFADFLTAELNASAGEKLVRSDKAAGVHVAGIHMWNDGVERPTFYHIHNGHLTTEVVVQGAEQTGTILSGTESFNAHTGSALVAGFDPVFLAAFRDNAEWRYETKAQPREAFKVHSDFGPELMEPQHADEHLKNRYLTRNGDYVPYVIVASAMNATDTVMNNFARSHPDNERIGPRVGTLYRQLQAVIQQYRTNKLDRIIDGEITTLGIRRDGTYLHDEEFKRSEWLQTPPMTPIKKA